MTCDPSKCYRCECLRSSGQVGALILDGKQWLCDECAEDNRAQVREELHGRPHEASPWCGMALSDRHRLDGYPGMVYLTEETEVAPRPGRRATRVECPRCRFWALAEYQPSEAREKRRNLVSLFRAHDCAKFP